MSGVSSLNEASVKEPLLASTSVQDQTCSYADLNLFSSSTDNNPYQRRRLQHAASKSLDAGIHQHRKQTLVVNAQSAAGRLVDIPENEILARKESSASSASGAQEHTYDCCDFRSSFMSHLRLVTQLLLFLCFALVFLVLVIYMAKMAEVRRPGSGGRYNKRHRHRTRAPGLSSNVSFADGEEEAVWGKSKKLQRNLLDVASNKFSAAYVTYATEWDQFHSAVFLGCSLLQTGTVFDMIMFIDSDSVLPRKSRWEIGGWVSKWLNFNSNRKDVLENQTEMKSAAEIFAYETYPEELSIAQTCGWKLEFIVDVKKSKRSTSIPDAESFGFLKLFNLTGYDKVVYLSPTALVFRNIDFVADCPGGFCSFALEKDKEHDSKSMGSLVFNKDPIAVLTPSTDLFSALNAHIELLGSPSVDTFLRNYLYYYCKSELSTQLGVAAPENSVFPLKICPNVTDQEDFSCKCWSLSQIINVSNSDNMTALGGIDPRMVHLAHFHDRKPWEWRNYPFNGWLVLWDQYAAQFPGAFQHYHIDDSVWNWFWLLSPCGPVLFITSFILTSRLLLRKLVFPFTSFHPIIQWLGFRSSNLYFFVLLLSSLSIGFAFFIAYVTGLIVPRSVFPVHHAIWAICFVAFAIVTAIIGSYLVFCYDSGLLLQAKTGYYSILFDRSSATWQRVYESVALAFAALCSGMTLVFRILYWFRWHPGIQRTSFLLLVIASGLGIFSFAVRRCSSVLYVLGASSQFAAQQHLSALSPPAGQVDLMMSEFNHSPRKRKSVKSK